MSAIFRNSPILIADVISTFVNFQITYTLVRNGAGLGINIAGGKGSTPYRENDEVCRSIFSSEQGGGSVLIQVICLFLSQLLNSL